MIAQKGFTLIELLIVLVIIGVLAMFAIPQFQNRTAIAQVSRVTMETSQIRSAVDICLMQGSKGSDCKVGWTKSNLLADDGTATTATDTNPNTGQSGLKVTLAKKKEESSTIEATLGGDAATFLHDKKIIWTREDSGSWSCTTDVGDDYRTQGCKDVSTAPAAN